MRKIRSHLTYANVVASLALVLVVAGGTAAAATYVVSSNSQVGPDTISGHKPRTGQQANIIGGTVNGTDIATGGVVGRNVNDGSLTGADIADRSGVDTCQPTLTVKLGPICAGSDGKARSWNDALGYCTGFGLRLPSVSEAVNLAKNYDVPGVGNSDSFWTDEASLYPDGGGGFQFDAYVVDESGLGATLVDQNQSNLWKTVCVTDPSA